MPRDPEPQEIHGLRTRIRHVLTIATIAPEPTRHLLAAITAIRKAAGRVRDLDVLSAYAVTLSADCPRDAGSRLLRRLRKMRKRAVAALQKTLDLHSKNARTALAGYAQILRRANASTGPMQVAQQFESALREKAQLRIAQLSHELADWPEPDESNLHDFRVKAKTLRTLLQLTPGSDAAQIKILGRVTSRIGQWHDLQLLAALANQCLEPSLDFQLIDKIDRLADLNLKRAIRAALSLRERPRKGVVSAGSGVATQSHNRVA